MTNTQTLGGRMNVHGAAIAYRLEGPANAPVLMLGNSLAADMGMWEDNVPAFTREFRVLRYDMRGHGASSTPPGPYSLAQLADDAVALLDALRIERVHYLGLSLGGMVGQRLGAQHGQRMAGLVLCATMHTQVMPAAWEERAALVRREGMAAVVDATLQRWFTPDFHASRPQELQRVRAMILATRAEGYAACSLAIRDLDQAALLPQVKAPTLVVAGESDPAATPAIAREIAQGIPGAQLQVIERAAHLPNIEQPRDFEACVLEFLRGCATATRA